MAAPRPLNARSVVLSLLLGVHPPRLPPGALVLAGDHVGVTEATLRVALSRMTARGDLTRGPDGYTLSPRLVARQVRQDAALDPPTVPWDGTWRMLVVTPAATTSAERAERRAALMRARLGELREGVWLRPANLADRPPLPTGDHFVVRPEDAAALAARLWDLSGWSADGERLLADLSSSDATARFAAAAAIIRHLLTDPVLPPGLQPDGWPGAALRTAYLDYQAEWGRMLAGLTHSLAEPGTPR